MDSSDPLVQQLHAWIREGPQLLSRVVEECDSLRRKVSVAEERWRQLSDIAQNSEREIRRVANELDDCRRQRTDIAHAMQAYVAEMRRLTDELVAKLTNW